MTTELDTRSKFHPLRVQGRKLAADLLAKAQASLQERGDGAVTDHAIAKRWGRIDESGTAKPLAHSAVGALFDAGSGHAMAFGDVLALPKELAREALMRALASFDEGAGPGTRDTLDAIAIDLGVALQAYRADLADGREDAHVTHANNLLRIATLAVRGYLASQRKTVK